MLAHSGAQYTTCAIGSQRPVWLSQYAVHKSVTWGMEKTYKEVLLTYFNAPF